MTCRQIEALLPAYMEDALSPPEKQIIEEHLSACDGCSRSLAELKAAGDLLSGLEEVEPPPWLQAKIMSRVKKEVNWKEELFKRLFRPLRIKAPIQIFATVIIAVMAYTVYWKEEPELKRLAPPPPPVYEAAKGLSAEVGSRNLPAMPPAGPFGKKHANPTKDIAKTNEEKAALSPSAGVGGKIPPGALTKEKEVAPEVERPGPPIGASREEAVTTSLDATKTAMPDKLESRTAAKALPTPSQELNLQGKKVAPGTAAKEGGKYETGLAGTARRQSISADKSPSIDVILHVPDRENAIREIESCLAGFDGRLLLRQAGIEKTVLTMKIPGKNAPAFLEKLKSIGEIHRREMPLDFSAGPVTVRIEIPKPP